jgi:subtilase family serine protease
MRGLAALAILALLLVSCGGRPGGMSSVPQASGATRVASDTATYAGGAMALPGGGAMALPGGGAMALPGELLGGLPILSNVLAILTGALPTCAVVQILVHSAQCNALLNLSVPVNPDPNLNASQIVGYHPSQLASAYHLPTTNGSGKTVATVVAGDDPTAESDLAVYRHAFGLPACTSSNGCFRKVNQKGNSSSYPAPLSGWPQEAGIDIEMISAACPNCNILLVEVDSADLSDLESGVDVAARLGAAAINNSYYAPEYGSEVTEQQHFNHPGVEITASSGDVGYGATFPASSSYVTAVGGTTLTLGLTIVQTVWAASGSGCSMYVSKPAWQHDSGCPNRTVGDMAAVADPMTGVAVYNTTAPSGQVGWGVYGGTSVAAPIVAAAFALSGNGAGAIPAEYAYAHPGAFGAVLLGANGTCSQAYLCTGGLGYRGPSGLGTPNGVGGL